MIQKPNRKPTLSSTLPLTFLYICLDYPLAKGGLIPMFMASFLSGKDLLTVEATNHTLRSQTPGYYNHLLKEEFYRPIADSKAETAKMCFWNHPDARKHDIACDLKGVQYLIGLRIKEGDLTEVQKLHLQACCKIIFKTKISIEDVVNRCTPEKLAGLYATQISLVSLGVQPEATKNVPPWLQKEIITGNYTYAMIEGLKFMQVTALRLGLPLEWVQAHPELDFKAINQMKALKSNVDDQASDLLENRI